MSSERPLRLRFAPSPTGSLHLGNARTALFNWILARQSGGAFVLRIEDTDLERHRDGAERGIVDDLAWLGLDWDEGPDRGGAFGPYRQSERSDHYRAAVDSLLVTGRAYRCFCAGEQLAAERDERLQAGRAPHYAGHCRRLAPREAERRASAGEAHAVRFLVDPAAGADAEAKVVFRDRLRGCVEFPLRELGDTVILRRDGRPTYNFAVVVDDAAMAIDLVLRGDDHLSNTPRQVLMFAALGRPLPEFAHLPMVRGEDGSRLSKRHGAASLADYRRRGYPPEGLVNALALLGWSPPHGHAVVDRDSLLAEFDLARVNHAPAGFDQAKLDWVCAQHLQRLDDGMLGRLIADRWVEQGRLDSPPAVAADWIAGLGALARASAVSHLDQAVERLEPLFAAGGEPADPEAAEALRAEGAEQVIVALADVFASEGSLTAAEWQLLKAEVKRASGRKGRDLFHPIRVALTGRVAGAELDAVVPLIGRGHELFPTRIASPRQRVERTAAWMRGSA